MKKYTTLEIKFVYLCNADVVTESEQTDSGTNLLADAFDEYSFGS